MRNRDIVIEKFSPGTLKREWERIPWKKIEAAAKVTAATAIIFIPPAFELIKAIGRMFGTLSPPPPPFT